MRKKAEVRTDLSLFLSTSNLNLYYFVSVVYHYNLVISTSGRYLVFSYDLYDFSLRFEMTYCIDIYETLY